MKDEAVALVDVLAPSDFILDSPIGHSNGKVCRYMLYVYGYISILTGTDTGIAGVSESVPGDGDEAGESGTAIVVEGSC